MPSIMDPAPVQQAPQAPQVPKLADLSQMREFGDSNATRKAIYDNVLSAAQSIEPVSNKFYSLGIEEPHWADEEHVTLAEQKKAILEGRTLARRLRGTWHLKDLEGNTVEKKLTTLAQVPHLSNHGTFVINGNEYSLASQMRLRAGVFTRIKDNGEIESHVNVMPGNGFSHHYTLEPETGVFKMQVKQSSMPLMPLLKAMGVTDKELIEHWGRDLHAVNTAHDDPRVIDKLYTQFVGRKGKSDATGEEKKQAVVHAMEAMGLDMEVTSRTLGVNHSRLNKDAILDSTKKLLAVSRGESDPDDRDHLAYQHFYGPEDLIAERLQRAKSIMHPLLWKATHKRDLSGVQPNSLTKHVQGAILDSGLGQPLEEVNAMDVLDQQMRVTRLGVGGIPSIDSIPMEARMVQPSHVGYIDLVKTPESSSAGIDSRVAYAARKGKDKRLYTPFIDPKTQQVVWKSPQDVADLTVAFPDSHWTPRGLVPARVKGKTRLVPLEAVDLYVLHGEQMFSPMANLVPLKSMAKGQRGSMGSRFIAQALPLDEPEAPFVRGQVPGKPGYSFEEHYGKLAGTMFAKDQEGKVVNITPDEIVVKYADGSKHSHELYNHQPNNRKTEWHSTPLVQPGDLVKPGQLLARSSYTDEKGHVALGRNLRVAYIPFNSNYEDAFVISESAAKKLTSAHMYQHDLEWDARHRRGKKAFVSIFPATFGKKLLENIDDDGIIKPGSVLHFGDPMILAAKERELSQKQVHSAHKGSFSDQSMTWDHHSDGIVTDVAKTTKGVVVAVRGPQVSQVGDKISGRFGDKGVLSRVVPDGEMPHDSQGRPFEVLANPQGIISRGNPAQVLEAALGKISEITGQPYVVEDFPTDGKDMVEWGMKELEKHGLSDTETITDPVTGKEIPNILTGNRYYMKLHHTSSSKGQGRGLGAYSAEGEPARGGGEGAQSKRLALMEVHALLSSGATQVLRDAKLIRGQKNQEYWSDFMSGFKPATPRVPLVYEKFINHLKASGINVTRHGAKQHIMALTDKDIDHLAEGRELQNADTVSWKEGLKPIPGGLFDTRLTGGHGGNRWSHITLHEPMVSPVMEEPVRRLLGLTVHQFEDILAGKEALNGQKGPKAIQDALSRLNVDQMIEQTSADIKSGRKTARDLAIRKLGYLKDSKEMGLHPRDWVLSKVPVLPPAFRPVSVMQGTGSQLVSDANLLYKEVFDANQALKSLSKVSDDVAEERLNLYKAFKGVTGLGDPIQPKNQEKNIKGFLEQVLGSSPKFGVVQRKLLGATVDMVGRAVITPNPDLNMDQVGLPENRAWEVYTPFVTRRLVRRGVNRLQALQYVKDKAPIARQALMEEMNERPVLVSRAPVLHRYGMMAFWPRLTKGDVLQISPVVTAPFGADFDGDQSNYHVPASDEARDDAIAKMMPSRNLIGVATLKKPMYQPRHEYLAGLHAMTYGTNVKNRPRVFATTQDVIKAFYRGDIAPDQRIEVLEEDK